MPSTIYPALSVIVPTRNRAAELRACLDSIAQSQIPAMELIVVDDASTHSIANVVEACTASQPFSSSLLHLDRPSGSAAARNLATASARGDILLFIDDDVCIPPSAIADVLAAFQRDPTLGALIGRYDDAPSDPHFLSQFRNLLHAYTHRVSAGPAATFWTGFGAVRASIFREHGGFIGHTRSMYDVEFGTRLNHAGVRIELHAGLAVKHLKRWTLRSMLYTDLFLRGVPWTLILWRQRTVPNTLNLRRSSRLSVAFASLALLFLAASLAFHVLFLAAALCAAAVLLANLPFYAFLRDRRGLGFALGGIAAHWLYLWTAALSFAFGTTLFLARSLRGHPAHDASICPLPTSAPAERPPFAEWS